MERTQSRSTLVMLALLMAAMLSGVVSAQGQAQTEPKEEISARERQALLQGRILSDNLLKQSEAAVSKAGFPALSATATAGGGNIAFESNRTSNFNIFAQNVDPTETAVSLIGGIGSDVTPVWSPDDTQMVFSSDRDGDYDIFLRTAAGQEIKLTQNAVDDVHPAWSPDGGRIIFSSNRAGDYFQIYSMRTDGTDVRRIGVVPDNNAMFPRYSPDGSQIAFMRASILSPLCQWNWDVWLMDGAGNNQRRVTTRLGADLYPHWTPDGTQIIYASCRDFIDFDLYAASSTSTDEIQLTAWGNSNEWGAILSPNGDYLAFNADVEGNIEIYTVPAAGGNAANFTQNGADDFAASWGRQTISASPPPNKPPLVLVHGIQIFSVDGYNCSEWIGRFPDTATTLDDGDTDDTDHIAAWLAEDYEVWIAHLTSSLAGTPSLEENGDCLRQQINEVYAETGQQITIVAHSMGGVVSRACLSMADCRDKVKEVYTLGSPHAGLNTGLITKVVLGLAQAFARTRGITLPLTQGLCAWQPAACELSSDSMAFFFNPANSNRPGIPYTFIGGDKTPPWPGWLFIIQEGYNDGFIGRYSAIGWAYPFKSPFPAAWMTPSPPRQFWTDEVHIAGWGNAYYIERGTGRSQAYQCMTTGGNSSACRSVSATDLELTDTPPNLSETTVTLSGQLTSNQEITHTLQVDTAGATLFHLSSVADPLAFTLKRPDGQVIDPAYAAANPNLVTYSVIPGSEAFPASAVYSFENTVPGLWTLTIKAGPVDPAGVDYVAFVAMETNRTLSFTTDAPLYEIGSTANFTATLQGTSGGINTATITATLRRPDNVTDTLVLANQGNGLFTADYTIPNAPGYIVTAITAQGSDGSVSFTRQDDMLIAVSSPSAQLQGNYADTPVDSDGNGLYEALAFEADLAISTAGSYVVSANLTKNGQLISSHSSHLSLATGTQRITLQFSGEDIRLGQVNGPYTISDFIVTDLQKGGIPAVSETAVWTTAAYDFAQFGDANQVYLPIIIK